MLFLNIADHKRHDLSNNHCIDERNNHRIEQHYLLGLIQRYYYAICYSNKHSNWLRFFNCHVHCKYIAICKCHNNRHQYAHIICYINSSIVCIKHRHFISQYFRVCHGHNVANIHTNNHHDHNANPILSRNGWCCGILFEH